MHPYIFLRQQKSALHKEEIVYLSVVFSSDDIEIIFPGNSITKQRSRGGVMDSGSKSEIRIPVESIAC